MKTTDLIVRGVYFSIIAMFSVMAGVLANNNGLPPLQITIIIFATFCAGAAFGFLARIVEKKTSYIFLIAFASLLFLLTILRLHVIPICGDGVCGFGECGKCDCTPQQCADGICETKKERCDTSPDCACSVGMVCQPKRNQSVDGCVSVACGDSFCDLGESCCTDCGCKQGFVCIQNLCYFQPPTVTYDLSLLTRNISALTLYANPLLTNNSGTPLPLGSIVLQSTGPVHEVRVRFALDDVMDADIAVPDLVAGRKQLVLWYADPDPRLLHVRSDRQTNISITISYKDEMDDQHSIRSQVPVTLLDRNTLDEKGHLVLFVTSDIIVKEKTAQSIWDELRADMIMNSSLPDNKRRLPLETFTEGGSQQDLALLLASAYDAAGVQTYLVEGLDGNIYVRTRLQQRYVMIDPSRLNNTFEEAIVQRAGSAVHDIRKIRALRKFSIVSLRNI